MDGLAKIVTTPDADLDVSVTSSLSSENFSSTVLKGSTDLDTLLGKVRMWDCDFLHHTNHYTWQFIFCWSNMHNLFSPLNL